MHDTESGLPTAPRGFVALTGSLAPTFDSKMTEYSVDVDSAVGEVAVTGTLQDADAIMTVNGLETISSQARTISLSSEPSTPISLVVTSSNGNQNTYTITVNRAALEGTEKLQSLSVVPGAFTPAFDSSIAAYSVDVASAVNEVAVTATFENSNASMTVNGLKTNSGQVRMIPLGATGSTPIPIVLTAPDDSQNMYSVTVNRAATSGNNKLQSLSVSPGSLSPTFDAGKATYSVDVSSAVRDVAVTATPQDSNASITVNGLGTSSGQVRTIALQGPGLSTPISVAVTAPNGNQNTYALTVRRAGLSGNNNLRSLSVSPGALDTPFFANNPFYFVDVSSFVESIVVTAQPDDPEAVVVMNGQGATSLFVELSRGVPAAILIVVWAPNGTSKSYTVQVQRHAF